MQLSVPLENGYLADKYGKYASGADVVAGYPKTSFPITIEDAPAGTQSFALWLIDFDAVPVSGFPWIHWVAANIPGDTVLIPENASRSGVLPMIQGNNSAAGHMVNNQDTAINQGYIGPQPPNGDHAYTLTVFALDATLPLQNGFWLNDSRHAMAGHILAQAHLDLLSRK